MFIIEKHKCINLRLSLSLIPIPASSSWAMPRTGHPQNVIIWRGLTLPGWPCNKSFPVTVTPHPQQQHRTLDRTRALIHHYVLISISDNHGPLSSSSSAFTDCVVPYLRTKAQDININNNNDDDDNNTTDGTPSPPAIQTKVVQAGRQKQQNTVQRNHDYPKNLGRLA